MENQQPPSCTSCGPWWRLPLLLAVVFAAILWSRGRELEEKPHESDADRPAAPVDSSSREKVSLTIDFGDGRRETVEDVAWHEGMTVADLMSKMPGVRVTRRGSGESALVTAIDDISNEGADGKNWMYSVNGKMADRSYAVYSLRAGDQVLWTFGPRP